MVYQEHFLADIYLVILILRRNGFLLPIRSRNYSPIGRYAIAFVFVRGDPMCPLLVPFLRGVVFSSSGTFPGSFVEVFCGIGQI